MCNFTKNCSTLSPIFFLIDNYDYEVPLLSINGIPTNQIEDSKEDYSVEDFIECIRTINRTGIELDQDFKEEIADYFLIKYRSIEKNKKFYYPAQRMARFVSGYLKEDAYYGRPWH